MDLAFLQVDHLKYKEAYQILYRTTAAYESDPSVTVTTVIVPHNAQRDKLLNYLVYTDSNGAQCAPSYSMRQGGQFGTDLALSYQQLLLNTFLDEGYILTVPDYQGPKRSFAAGRLEGRMSLDGIRATLNFERIGLNKHTKVVTYGYSGGAIASGWSAALQPSYAPEINAVGFAMGGTPSNVTGTVQNLDRTLFAGFGITGVVGIYSTFTKVQKWSKGKILDKGAEAIEFARSHCMLDVLLKYPFAHLQSEEYFRGGTTLLHDPTVRSVVGDIVLGYKKSETPTAPVYMFHGLHDEVIPFSDAIKSGRNWAKHGADVYFQEYTDPISGHVVSELTNIPNSLFFVRDRFENKSFPKGWTHKKAANALDNADDRQKGLGALIHDIQDLIGREVGPGDYKIKNRIKKQKKF